MSEDPGDSRLESADTDGHGGGSVSKSRKSVSLAKTMRPGLLAVVQRNSLFERIDQGAERGVIWVAGPPGAGKTTLISSYLEHRRLRHLWYQVDRGDVDAATFFHYMGLAAARGASLDRHELPTISSTQRGDVATFSQQYFRALYQRLEPPFALVFDNYQEAPLQSPLALIIRIALEEISRRGSVIVISRSEPPRELARLRANQRIELIGWPELRLSAKELQHMARKRGQTLGEDATQSLHQRTQGWAAGAVLMLEHAKVMGTEAEPPSDNTPQVIFDYVAGEIFEKFEATSQAFLLSMACLSQMTPVMAEKLSGYSKAGPLLANLARNDYFVSERFVDGEHVYQFHRLLSAFLRTRAKQVYTTIEWAKLVRRSGWLLAEVGQADNAVSLLLDESQWQEAMELIVAIASEILSQGRAETLSSWLDELPPAVAANNPWTLYWQAACRRTTAPRESRRYYELAFQGFHTQANPNPEGMALACSGIIDIIVHDLDDLSLLDPWITALQSLWNEHRSTISDCIEHQVARSALMALLVRRPGCDEHQTWLDTALGLCRQSPEESLHCALAPAAALSLMWTGQYAQASDLMNAARASSASDSCPADALEVLNVAESAQQLIVACLIGVHRVEEHQQDPQHSVNLRETTRPTLHSAISHLTAGRIDRAESLLQEMSVPAARRLERGMWHYLNAWINILRGDRFGAYQQIQTALAIATEVGSPDFDTLCRLAWTETLAVCGDSRRAASQLRRAREHRQPSENPLLNFIASLTTARVLLDSGGRDEVLASLKDALSIGHRHGFTCSLWWRPDAMAELCAMALAHDMEVDYVRHIIRTNRLTPVDSATDLRSWPWSFQVFTLGKFRLVKEGTTQSLVGKGSRRPLELLKVLIALGGRDVRVEHLTDILWPNTDGDYAYGSFTSTLHRLRRLLEVDEAVTLQDGRLNLNAEYFWVDTWTIEKLFAATDRDAAAWLSFASVTAAAEHLLDLYRGAFLEDESKLSCHIVLREHLRGKMQRLLTKIARHAKESSHIEAASSFFERAIDADPLCEGFYRDLMLLYDALGRRTEALDVYGRCHTVLTSRLRASPSPETIAIYDKLRHEDSFS